MLKTAEEQKLEDDSNKYFYMNKVIDNIKVKQQNGRLWTPYHDMQLYEYVIKYNFNFYEISNAFQRLCTNDKKYEYSEDAVRLHWAFLHSMRHFGQTPDEAYYQRMKLQYDKEKPKTFKKRVEEKEEVKLSEEEDMRKMKQEFEKMMEDKYGKDYKGECTPADRSARAGGTGSDPAFFLRNEGKGGTGDGSTRPACTGGIP